MLCCVRGRAKRWVGVIRSFARRADGDAGRNGGAEAQRYEQQQPWDAIGFLGEDLPVRYDVMIVLLLFSVFFFCVDGVVVVQVAVLAFCCLFVLIVGVSLCAFLCSLV